MLLFGLVHSGESQEKSNGSNQGGPPQRASALAALSSAFNPSSDTKSAPASRPSGSGQGSQRAAAVAALSQVLTAEKKPLPKGSPLQSTRSPPSEESFPVLLSARARSEIALSEVEDSKEVSEVKETRVTEPVRQSNGDDSGSKQEAEQEPNDCETSHQNTFSYEQLKAHSDNPVTGIDFKRREAYLSDEEFQTVLGMLKEDFYKLPKWKQDVQKKKCDLF